MRSITVAALLVATCPSTQDAPQAKRIDGWIDALGHENVDVREEARGGIRGVALDLRRVLDGLAAAKQSTDPDKAQRAAALRKSIAEDLWQALEFDPDLPPPKLRQKAAAESTQELTAYMLKARELVSVLEDFHVAKDESAEGAYQKFLKFYEALAKHCVGDPGRVSRLDAYKHLAEAIHGGSERLVQRASKLLEALHDCVTGGDAGGARARLEEMREIRNRREFFRDERLDKLDKLIRTAESLLPAPSDK